MHSACIILLYIILVHVVHIKLYVWFIYVLLYYHYDNSNHGTIMTQN